MIVKPNSWLLRRLASGSTNWNNPFGKQSDRRRIWTQENARPFDPAVPLLGINLKEIIQQKRGFMHEDNHFSIIYNSRN